MTAEDENRAPAEDRPADRPADATGGDGALSTPSRSRAGSATCFKPVDAHFRRGPRLRAVIPMPVETHRCDVCGDFRGEHEEVRQHVAESHDVDENSADDHVEPLDDRGV